MAKVIVVNAATNEEHIVATVKSDMEAFQFASLLQAMVDSDNYRYYIEYKSCGIRRSSPDSFLSMVNSSERLTKLLYHS